MEANPTVSVVIPTYNAPRLLLETLGTVFAQTFQDYEIVIINDGCTDDTLDQLAPLQRQYGDKLRIITQPNAGIGAARNRGLDESRGKYVALLDHDDLWMPDKLQTQVNFLESHPQCVAAGVPFSLSTTPDHLHFNPAEVTNAQGIVERPFWQLGHGRDVIVTSALMVNRKQVQGIRYSVKRGPIEDVPFHIKIMTRGEYGMAGNKILAIYRIHATNASKNLLFYYGGIKVLRQMQRAGEFSGLPPQQKADMEYFLAHLARATAVMQIGFGKRIRGLELYLREFLWQLRQLRIQFLLAFPIMLLIPHRVLQKAYVRRTAKRSARTIQ